MKTSRATSSVCIVVPHYLPSKSYGGPIVSVQEIINLLDSRQSPYIVKCLNSYYDTNQSIETENKYVNVDYLAKFWLTWFLNGYRSAMQTRVIYINSFFHPYASFWFLLGVAFACLMQGSRLSRNRLVISPRGELLWPRIKTRKKFLKLAYIRLMQLILSTLSLKTHFVASAQAEHQSVQGFFPACELHIIPNLFPRLYPALNSFSQWSCHDISKKPLSLIYFSRISPEKGLLEIIRELDSLKIDFIFNVYGGAVSNAYYSKCKAAASSSNLKNKVFFRGPYERSEIPRISSNSDIFIYRPIAENFSHAFFEALMCGIIPIVPSSMPWRFDLDDINNLVFYDTSIDNSFSLRLLAFKEMPTSERDRLRSLILNYDLPSKVMANAARQWKDLLLVS